MDGRKTKLTDSLQFRLSATLSVLIASLAIAAGVVSYTTAFDEAIEWQDGNLRQMSAMTDGRSGIGLPATVVDTVPDPDLEVIVQVIGAANVASAASPLKVSGVHDGLQTVHVDGEAWRLFVRPLEGSDHLVVAQRSAERDEVAGKSALRAVLPLAALLPVLIALVSVVVRRALRPIVALSSDLDRRSEHDLGPLPDEPVPNELKPFTASINQLLSKLAVALVAQRRFVADAAHELRSPLTALTLQAEQLEARLTTANEVAFMARMQAGMRRMQSLLDQLLTLARAEAAGGEGSAPATCVGTVLREVIEENVALAESRQIDLGVVGELDGAPVAGKAADLHALFRNLVDNAIRYSPAGGRVDIAVRCAAGRVLIDIADEGPGIAEPELERVFDPFYRALGNDAEGSGLGLSIVRVIVDRLGGTVSLGPATAGRGLRVALSLPRADAGGDPAPSLMRS